MNDAKVRTANAEADAKIAEFNAVGTGAGGGAGGVSGAGYRHVAPGNGGGGSGRRGHTDYASMITESSKQSSKASIKNSKMKDDSGLISMLGGDGGGGEDGEGGGDGGKAAAATASILSREHTKQTREREITARHEKVLDTVGHMHSMDIVADMA
jgi:hypothetical protein